LLKLLVFEKDPYFYIMNLFDSVMLFDEGRKQFKDFALPGTDLRLWEQFFSRTESDNYYKLFLETCPWQQRQRKMWDKLIPDPRLTAYYGGEKGLPWTKELYTVKERVEATAGVQFNRVLLNYYRDGNDSVSWHSDTLPADGVHHEIASVTFGETRLFKVRHKTDSDINQVSIPLTHGSFLLMGASMQDLYEHHVPKTKKAVGPRINLTFRIADFSKKIYYAGSTG
jgi:alkylated DNA repair dioxygenase AlkB